MGAPAFGVWLAAAADATAFTGHQNNREHEPDRPHFAFQSSAEPAETASATEVEPGAEAALLTRLRANDEAALREVMALHTVSVLRVAYHYLRHEELAYEVAQDVFVAIWNRRHVLDERTPIVHYLRRAARNRALNVLKHNTAQARLAEKVALEGDAAATQNQGPLALRAAEVDTIVRRIVSTLTPRVREVLLLYYERGLEPGEIAETLGIAPRTVYGQLRTALRKLAEALAAHDDLGPE